MLIRHLSRGFHTTRLVRDKPTTLTNIFAGGIPPPVQVSSITPEGIQLEDGIVIPSACIFLEGKVFLWDVPLSLWSGWTKDHLEIFEVSVPKPGKHPNVRHNNGHRLNVPLPRDLAVWNGTKN